MNDFPGGYICRIDSNSVECSKQSVDEAMGRWWKNYFHNTNCIVTMSFLLKSKQPHYITLQQHYTTNMTTSILGRGGSLVNVSNLIISNGNDVSLMIATATPMLATRFTSGVIQGRGRLRGSKSGKCNEKINLCNATNQPSRQSATQQAS